MPHHSQNRDRGAHGRTDRRLGVVRGAATLLLLMLSLVAAAGSEPYLYGPVRPGEQLTRIAEALRPDPTPDSTWQMMSALYRANPRAFIDGDIHRLRPGAMLVVPVDAEVRAVDPARARALALAPRAPPVPPGRLALSEQLGRSAAPGGAAPGGPARAGASERATRSPPRGSPPRRNPPPRAAAPATQVPPAAAPVPSPDPVPAPQPPPPRDDGSSLPAPERWRLLETAALLPPRAAPPSRDGLQLRLTAALDLGLQRRPAAAAGQPRADREQGLHGLLLGSAGTAGRLPGLGAVRGHLAPALAYRRTSAHYAPGGQPLGEEDGALGVQAAWLESAPGPGLHWRAGVQPVIADGAGLLFVDEALGIRWSLPTPHGQLRLALLRRMQKHSESALNDPAAGLREDDVLLLTLERPDLPRPGLRTQWLYAHHRNDEGGTRRNDQGLVERPAPLGLQRGRNFFVNYLGAASEGRIGALDLNLASYLALGQEDRGSFVDRSRNIRAGLFAAELGWHPRPQRRWRLTALWASGDDNALDGSAGGFDAIAENPRIAGAASSLWIGDALPLTGSGVPLSIRQGLLPSLRSSRAHGQSNFANPGLVLLGVGTERWLQPGLRLSLDLQHLWFQDTDALEQATAISGIDRALGWDLAVTALWRPAGQDRLAFRLSGAALIPGTGMRDLAPHAVPYGLWGGFLYRY